MNRKRKIFLMAAVFVLVVVFTNIIFFIVNEKEEVVITQFGRVVRTISTPGIYIKAPAPIQNLLRFSKKLNVFELVPTEILTKDKKNLLINNYVVWRIGDSLKFYRSVRDVKGALLRMEDMIYSQMRNEVGLHSFSEIISSAREEISANLLLKAKAGSAVFGIDIIDARLKRISFPTQNLRAVYDRMIAERQKMATKYRSEGQEESIKIHAKTDKEKTIILAKSYKNAEKIKGEGDAKALKNYAKVIKKDVEYYDFVRSMETYKKIFKKDTTMVLSSETDFLKYLIRPKLKARGR